MSPNDLASKNLLGILILLKSSPCCSERALAALLITVRCKHLLHFADTTGVPVELQRPSLVHNLSSTYYIAARSYPTHHTIVSGHVLVNRSSNAKLILCK